VSNQPKVSWTQAATAVYAPSAQITCRRGSSPRTRSSKALAPSRSWTSAGRTAKPQIKPSVSTSTCRLRPPIFFPRVVALGATRFRGLDSLAVHHRGAGSWFAAFNSPHIDAQGAMDLLPNSVGAPSVEVVRHCFPRGKVVRQHAPGATASCQINNRVDDLTPLVGAWPATRARGSGQQRLDQTPLQIAEITGIALPCVVHAARVNKQAKRRKDQFLDGLLVM